MSRFSIFQFSLAIFVTSSLSTLAESDSWPNWRGPSNNGSVATGNLPTQWNDSNFIWKVDLPGKGCSTPVVLNKTIYLTAPVNGHDAVVAYDWSGKLLWQTELGDETPGKHRNASGCNPSPVTDGKTIFVSFKSGNVAALNLDGSIRWKMNQVGLYGPINLFWDFGTSPVLTGKNVVLARMHSGESWLAAFDKETGELRWKTDRTYETPKEVDNGYTTPILIQHEGQEALLTWGAQHLTIHSAAEGKLLWSCGDFNPAATPLWPAVATPIISNGMAVVCFGRADKGAPKLHGVSLSGSGDVTATNHKWMRDDTSAFVPSPVEYKGHVYVLSDRGQLDCIEPTTGKSLWTANFPRSSSNFYASPVIAGGVMYAPREDGTVLVAQVDGEFKLLAENKLDDKIIASVISVGNRIFVRGMAHLYSIGNP